MFPLLSSQHCVAQPAYQLIYPPICLSLCESARLSPTDFLLSFSRRSSFPLSLCIFPASPALYDLPGVGPRLARVSGNRRQEVEGALRACVDMCQSRQNHAFALFCIAAAFA